MTPTACPTPWKTCSCCGRAISREEWQRLEYLGVQEIPEDEFGPAESLEYRNDTCGSTLAVEVVNG